MVRRMGRDGWLGVGWPVRYGGRGFGQVEQQIFANEAALADVPLPAVTLPTVGPTLMEHGTRWQQDFFLPRILAGEMHFAIGYTEPEAGTDLAALRTSAVLDGDTTSSTGRRSSPPARTTPTTSGSPAGPTPAAPRHLGLSILIVDTRRPRVLLDPDHHARRRPSRQRDLLLGRARPVAMRVGAENDGWRLITTQLNHERVMLGAVRRIGVLHDRVRDWAARQGQARTAARCSPSPTSARALARAGAVSGSTSC